MSEDIPDRMATFKDSPHYDRRYPRLGIRFNGQERPSDVIEYCRSEGWIRIKTATRVDKRILTEKLFGEVEPYWRRPAPAPVAPRIHVAAGTGVWEKAEAKRKRKAAKRVELMARQS